MPFTIGDLKSYALAGEKILPLLQALTGPQIWKVLLHTALGTTNESANITVVPRQAANLLLHTLERIKVHLDNLEETKKAAAASYVVMCDTSKKRRAAL